MAGRSLDIHTPQINLSDVKRRGTILSGAEFAFAVTCIIESSQDCGRILSDPVLIARQLRYTVEEVQKLWPALEVIGFELDGDARYLVYPWQRDKIAEWQETHNRSVEAGRRGGHATSRKLGTGKGKKGKQSPPPATSRPAVAAEPETDLEPASSLDDERFRRLFDTYLKRTGVHGDVEKFVAACRAVLTTSALVKEMEIAVEQYTSWVEKEKPEKTPKPENWVRDEKWLKWSTPSTPKGNGKVRMQDVATERTYGDATDF